jgi:hypothetical protein
MRSTTAVLLCAAALVVPAAAAVGVDAARTSAPARKVAVTQAAIATTPATVRLVADPQKVRVRVSYACSNNASFAHYLTGEVRQPIEGSSDDIAYVHGYRNDTGGLKRARCTGRPVVQVLTFERSSNGAVVHPDAYLEPGQASFTFAVSRHSAQGPGWYQWWSSNTVTRGVRVVAP